MDTTPLIMGGGSAICGYFMGLALKKILKWVIIGLGVIAGIVFMCMQYLANKGYIQNIKWDALGNAVERHAQQLYTAIDPSSLHGVFHTLGIPATGGLGIGLLAGFVKTH